MQFEDITVGATASFSKTITEADILLFGGVSGDMNPAHFDDDYAKGTMFKGRIAHGMISAGLISAVLGTKLPGEGAIYMSQELKFRAPVRPGDTVKASVEVTAIDSEKRRVTLTTQCHVGDTLVVDGEAKMFVLKPE